LCFAPTPSAEVLADGGFPPQATVRDDPFAYASALAVHANQLRLLEEQSVSLMQIHEVISMNS